LLSLHGGIHSILKVRRLVWKTSMSDPGKASALSSYRRRSAIAWFQGPSWVAVCCCLVAATPGFLQSCKLLVLAASQ